jgi:ribose/xylose/arabinose/galactoside ABC-type transport system permease subunit
MTDTANFENQNKQIPFIKKFVNSYKERTLFSILLTIFLLLFLYGVFSTDNYLTIFNFKTIIRDAALYGIMAIGLTFVTLSGNFFLLSIKETASICCVAFAVGMSTGFGIEAFEGNFYIALLVALSIGLVAGAIQGLFVGLGGNPIVVTLGGAGILYGIAAWWSDNLVVSFRRPHDAEWLGTGSLFGLPSITWSFILIAIGAEFILKKTNFGRKVYLIGANRAAGKATGHENFSMAIIAFTICSICCAFVAVAFAAQMSSAQANYFSAEFGSSGDMTILVIATVMVGGNSIMGGYGSTIRTSIGAIFIAMIDNMMVLNGLNSGPRVVGVGLMIVFSILVFALFAKGSRAQE